MKKALILSAAVLFSMLTGCGKTVPPAVEADTVQIEVYRLIAPEYRSSGQIMSNETVNVKKGEDLLHAALNSLDEQPKSQQLVSALPDGVRILSYSLEDGELHLELSEEYLDLSGMEKTLADYGLALTLCKFDEVETVSVYVDGEAVSQRIDPEKAMLFDTESDPYNKQVKLYFSTIGSEYMNYEYHSLSVDEGASLEKVIIEELLRGPNSEELYSYIPQGTELLYVSTSDGVCTVVLSDMFFSNRPASARGERQALYSLVNSLTSIAEIEKVKILSASNVVGQYAYIDLTKPLERNEAIIYSNVSAAEYLDTRLYFSVGNGKLAALPRMIELDEYISTEENVIKSLFTDPGERGYNSAFRSKDRVISAETRDGVCTVNLPQSFFEFRAQGELILAIGAISASLTELEGVDSVVLEMDGGQAIYNGNDYSQATIVNEDMIRR